MGNARRRGARGGGPTEGASPGVVPVDRTPARVYASLGTIALVLSGYLVYTHFQLHRLATWTSLCNVSDTVSCDAVALSPYGTLMGFPLAGWGAWFYMVLTVGDLLALRGWRVVRSPALWFVAASGFSVVLSMGLAAISAFALRTWCPVCLVLYGLNAGMLVTAWLMLRRTGEGFRVAVAGELRYLRRHQGGITLAAGAALVVLGAAWIAYPKGFAPTVSVCKFLEQRAEKASGAPSPAVMVVYSDFQCPHCASAHRALKEARRGTVVRVENRHFPLDTECNSHVTKTLHPDACLQAIAAVCAEEQGQLEAYSDELFERGTTVRVGLVGIAEYLGLDRSAFEACLSSDLAADRLQEDIDSAAEAGVNGTPAVFVDGRRISGAIGGQDLSCLSAPRPD